MAFINRLMLTPTEFVTFIDRLILTPIVLVIFIMGVTITLGEFAMIKIRQWKGEK